MSLLEAIKEMFTLVIWILEHIHAKLIYYVSHIRRYDMKRYENVHGLNHVIEFFSVAYEGGVKIQAYLRNVWPSEPLQIKVVDDDWIL